MESSAIGNPEGGEKNKRGEVISRSDCHLVTKARVRERIIYRVSHGCSFLLASNKRNDLRQSPTAIWSRRNNRFLDSFAWSRRCQLHWKKIKSLYFILRDVILWSDSNFGNHWNCLRARLLFYDSEVKERNIIHVPIYLFIYRWNSLYIYIKELQHYSIYRT